MDAQIMLIGSSGRVGKMVGAGWRSSNRPWRNAPFQVRNGTAPISPGKIVWDVDNGLEPLLRWIESYGEISAFVVLAGTTPATGADMGANIHIATKYLDAALAASVPRVLLASSSAVYGPGDGTPLSETAACNPINAYGVSKRKMEQAAEPYKDAGLDVCCLRIGNIAGADAMLLNAASATSKNPIRIDQFPDGKGPLRSYIGPSAFGDCLGQLATHTGSLPFLLNVAAPNPVHMESLADAALLPWAYRAAPAVAIQNISLECQALCDLVNFPMNAAKPREIALDWLEHRDQ